MANRVLVTGANGMLGTDVCSVYRTAGAEVIATGFIGDVVPMDVTDEVRVESVIEQFTPNLVVHCAAYTQVDRAESGPDLATAINVTGSLNVARACARFDIPVCAISTDFVFDGEKRAPYVETDGTAPLGVYGQSKLDGEKRIADTCPKSWIVRTAWLFGAHGSCFPNTILNRVEAGLPCRVVSDQTGSPTFTGDLALAILSMTSTAPYGLYHAVNAGQATWFELAQLSVKLAGLDESLITPIASSEWPTPVQRPAYSVLSTHKLQSAGIASLPPWQDALARFIDERAAAKQSNSEVNAS